MGFFGRDWTVDWNLKWMGLIPAMAQTSHVTEEVVQLSCFLDLSVKLPSPSCERSRSVGWARSRTPLGSNMDHVSAWRVATREHLGIVVLGAAKGPRHVQAEPRTTVIGGGVERGGRAVVSCGTCVSLIWASTLMNFEALKKALGTSWLLKNALQ